MFNKVKWEADHQPTQNSTNFDCSHALKSPSEMASALALPLPEKGTDPNGRSVKARQSSGGDSQVGHPHLGRARQPQHLPETRVSMSNT